MNVNNPSFLRNLAQVWRKVVKLVVFGACAFILALFGLAMIFQAFESGVVIKTTLCLVVFFGGPTLLDVVASRVESRRE